MYKNIYKTGLLFYMFYIVLSLFFYKERAIFLDTSYYLFDIVSKNDFTIQRFRFIAVITEVLPLLLRKMSASLTMITASYSLSFSILYAIAFWICGGILKQYKIALCLLIFNVLFVTHTFYWPPSELPQGVALFCIAIAVINYEGWKSLALPIIISTLCMITVAFAHTLLLSILLFLIAFQFFNKNLVEKKKLLYWASTVFIIAFVVKAQFYTDDYDKAAMDAAKQYIKDFWANGLGIPTNKRFLQNCLRIYYWIPITGVGISVLYILQKKWLKLLFFLVAIVGFALLTNVSYSYAGAPDFYMENLYLPIAFMLAVPIVYDVLPYLQEHNSKAPLVLISIIALTGLVRIYINNEPYTNRLHWERGFLEKNEGKKLLIQRAGLPKDTLIMTWGVPYEFWLLSTIEHQKTASFSVHENPMDFSWVINNQLKKDFVTQWGVFGYSELPEKYFKFTDSTSLYQVIENPQK